MNIAMKRIMIAGGLALVIGGTAITLAQTTPQPWVVGDVFVATGVGKYEVWSNAGTKKQDILIGTSLDPGQSAGCWFDSQFNLYTADSGNTQVFIHPLAIPHTPVQWVDTELNANNGHSTSIVMAVNGDVFVGNPGGGSPSKSILRYRSDKTFLTKYNPTTESGGIDWMDLATDQRTMFYTSRGRKIMRFNAAGLSGNQLPDFATLPAGSANTAYAIRLLPPFDANASGGLLVADNAVIRKVNGSGVSTYDVAGEDSWRSLNLDPDGITFWAGGFTTGKLYRFNIATGTQVGSAIQTGGANALMGLCVMGEAQLQVWAMNLSNTTNATVLKDQTAKFGDPTATSATSSYSFSTWRLRINVKANRPNVVTAIGFTPQTTDLQCLGTPDDDFDCRFTSTPAQCVPFFNDPSADDTGQLDRYRCAFYRVKDMPLCQANNAGACPFQEDFVPGTNDILSEILMNLTNPPSINFSVTPYGPAPKGNPRLMRDPDSIELGTGPLAKQFFIDATTAIIDWPAFGTGTPNDYSPAMRKTDTGQGTGQGCVDIIGPNGNHANGGSVLKIVIEVKDGVRGSNGLCTGNPLADVLTPPNNITLAISHLDFLDIFCVTPGLSLGCFTPVPGQTARFQTTFDLLNPPFVPDTTNPYIFAITSVNVPSADPNTQGSGMFPPVCKKIWVCPTGNNCIPPGANLTCQ